MTTAMPALETDRLIVRVVALEDLAAIHGVLCRAWHVPADKQAALLPER